jgi:hypothetical protein
MSLPKKAINIPRISISSTHRVYGAMQAFFEFSVNRKIVILLLCCSPLRHEALERRTLWLTPKEVSHAPPEMGGHDQNQDRAAGLAGQACGLGGPGL